jgi:hypothetical protein
MEIRVGAGLLVVLIIHMIIPVICHDTAMTKKIYVKGWGIRKYVSIATISFKRLILASQNGFPSGCSSVNKSLTKQIGLCSLTCVGYEDKRQNQN